MASREELRNERIKKINLLKERGIDPYPAFSFRDVAVLDAVEQFEKFAKKKKITMAGRIRTLRRQGGLVFLNFDDGTGTFQAMIKKDTLGDDEFTLFTETVDNGDFVEFAGNVFITKRKEKTLEVITWRMLAKALLPLPDKWSGLKDTEERFRKRYLDTTMSSESKGRFLMRSKIITATRTFLEDWGFIEVETPILQSHAGGAAALPFITHHNALDTDLYLRIAPELYLKRLLVGGFPKVYELGRNFRNEGIDVTHNPEFTMLEFYEAYSDAVKQMATVEKLIKGVIKKTMQKTTIEFDGTSINVGEKFAVIPYFELLKRYALIADPKNATKEEMTLSARQLGISVERGDTLEKIMDNIYKKTCRPKIIEPTFIVDYPIDYLPLAKKKAGENHLVDAFQLVIGGVELVKAFSELNDPFDQEQRFKKQEENKKEGDTDSQTTDEDYLEAMEYGMPPSGGVGIGVDRLVMLLTDTHNIRDVILFPILKQKQ